MKFIFLSEVSKNRFASKKASQRHCINLSTLVYVLLSILHICIDWKFVIVQIILFFRAIKTISKRLKEEEISNKKLKEFIIAERIKNGTYVRHNTTNNSYITPCLSQSRQAIYFFFNLRQLPCKCQNVTIC